MSTVTALRNLTQLAPCRVVASSNQSGTYFNGATNNGVGATFTYSSGTLTIDSVSVNLNDYVLLAGQTSAFQNGIYQCTQQGASGVAAILTRRGDFQCIEQIKGGYYVPVYAGTSYGGSVWTVVEPFPAAIGNPATSGANNINFATITAAGSSLYLQVANNLSDVASASTSVTNLGFTQSASAISALVGQLGNFQQATVTLNATQMAGAYATPVQLVGAPGAGKTIFITSAWVYLNYQGTAFATGTAPIIQYGNTVHGGGTIATASGLVAGDITATASQVRNLFPLATGAQTGLTNEGIFFSNATNGYTSGTGATVTFTVNYVTLTATI